MIDLPAQLAEYGYSLALGEITRPDGRPTGVLAYVQTRNRLTRVWCRSRTTNALVWSGQDVGVFLEKFWLAKKLTPPSIADIVEPS